MATEAGQCCHLSEIAAGMLLTEVVPEGVCNAQFSETSAPGSVLGET